VKPRSYRNRILVEAAIVLAIVTLANLVSLRLFTRADLTQGRVYSVSASTKQVLRGLDDIVNIKVYFSKKLPPYLTTLTRQVRDVLDDYRAYAGGNLVVEFTDPADDRATEERVRMMGIPQVQLNVIAKDKTEVMAGYLGIAVLYGDRKEVIPVVQNPSNLEYDLTSAIVKVTSKETRIVGFSAGHGEPAPDDAFEAVAKALGQQYQVATVPTTAGKPIAPDLATLIVAGPDKISDWDAFAIDQFLMRGGRVLFMINKIGIAQGTLEATRLSTKLDSLLVHYGVAVRPDLVVDRSCGTASFSAGYFTFTVPYLLWPQIGEGGFDETSPITNQLNRAVLPWTSSLEVTGAEAKGITATVLARSSAQSWVEERQLDLDPQREFKPTAETGPRNLAVLLSGRFKSYFAGKPVPVPEGATEPPEVDRLDESPETQMIVIGNSRFVEDPFLGQYPENRTFFLNAVDWLTLGDSLIGIRSRLVTTRPIKDIGERAKASIRFASTLGVPLAVIVWGLGRRYVRAARRRALATQYGARASGGGDALSGGGGPLPRSEGVARGGEAGPHDGGGVAS
jgi:ABC-2 type transport system permease protein